MYLQTGLFAESDDHQDDLHGDQQRAGRNPWISDHGWYSFAFEGLTLN